LTTGPAETRVGPNRELAADGMVIGGITASVRDLDRSITFYRALGFAVGTIFSVLPPYRPIVGFPEHGAARAAYVRRDHIALELVETLPVPAAAPSESAAAQLGLVHIRLCVDSLARVETIIAANGGHIVAGQGIIANGMAYRYCTDPDGLRILLSAVEDAGALPS